MTMGVAQDQSHWTMWCVVEVNPTCSTVSTIHSFNTTVSTMKMLLWCVEVNATLIVTNFQSISFICLLLSYMCGGHC